MKMFLIALLAALCFGCGGDSDPEPKQIVRPHTFITVKGFEQWTSGGGDFSVENHYAIICEKGESHELRGSGWNSGEEERAFLRQVSVGDRLMNSNLGKKFYLENVRKLEPGDPLYNRTDVEQRRIDVFNYKKEHDAWRLRQKRDELSKGPSWLQCYGPPYARFLGLTTLCLAVTACAMGTFVAAVS